MGFRFQRRLNLSGGWGMNLGKSGGSLSYRGRGGSIGTKGFSVRTGIPGLSYRSSWGKDAGAVAIIFIVITFVLAAIVVAAKIIIYVAPIIWQCLVWFILTSYDFLIFVTRQIKHGLKNMSSST